MPTEFGKKMKKTTAKRVAKKPEAASAATKKKAKKLGLKVSRSKPNGGRSALSESTLKKLIKNREKKLKAEKKKSVSKKKKSKSRYGSSLVSSSSGYSDGNFTLSGCPSSTDGSVCGPGVSTYSDHLTTSYPGAYVDPIAYQPGTAPDGANSWSANTPAHSSNWPTSEGFRSSYGKLLKRRAQIIKRLNALSR